MLFSLKLQRDNWENTLAVDPAKGKTGKKLYFHRTMEMKQPHTITEPYFKTVLNFRLIQQSEVVHLPLFQRNIRCREGGRTSSAVKGTLRQRLKALRLARLRCSRLRFAGHLAAPRPSMPHCRAAGDVLKARWRSCLRRLKERTSLYQP